MTLEALAAQIHRQLEAGEQCTIYEFELIRVWALNEGSRSEDRRVCDGTWILSAILSHRMVRHFRTGALKSRGVASQDRALFLPFLVVTDDRLCALFLSYRLIV
jgi:hypothetical protein